MENISQENFDPNKNQIEKFAQETLRYMRDILFPDFYGINLNNIELLGLKKICVQVHEDFDVSSRKFDFLIEVEDRFLREFFDMSYEDARQMLNTPDMRKEYFRRKQEEKNLI